MNQFKRHFPNFVDISEKPEWIDFETTDDLLGLYVVRKFENDRNFSHFAISGNILMAVYNDGLEWWVVGFIKDPSTIDLPKWEPKYKNTIFECDGIIVSSTGMEGEERPDGSGLKSLPTVTLKLFGVPVLNDKEVNIYDNKKIAKITTLLNSHKLRITFKEAI